MESIKSFLEILQKLTPFFSLVSINMFTRHFYEVEEVLLAMEWCIKRGRVKEAVFWCLELLESELQDLVIDKLFHIWIWHIGLGCLSVLPLLISLSIENDVIQLVCSLTCLPKEARDRSILVLLQYASSDRKEPDRTSDFPHLEPLFQQLQCSMLEKAFLRSVYQGKSRLAFDLSRPLWQENPSRVFTLLHKIQEQKQKNENLAEILTVFEVYHASSWPARACAVASVCLELKRIKRSFVPPPCKLPSEVEEAIHEWKSLTGRRKRRLFAIPSECLYRISERGCMSNQETTLKKLYQLSLEGCPFWNRVLEEEAPWLSDERKEAFYELYFPDDIPDEWSAADQEKSHGYGVLIQKELPNYQKYIKRWFLQVTARSYWSLDSDLQHMEKDWQEAIDQPAMEFVSTWCLTPVKKQFLVAESDF